MFNFKKVSHLPISARKEALLTAVTVGNHPHPPALCQASWCFPGNTESPLLQEPLSVFLLFLQCTNTSLIIAAKTIFNLASINIFLHSSQNTSEHYSLFNPNLNQVPEILRPQMGVPCQ
jgi:hypothetical protein